ncbi:hypothetical protein GGR58DRAFT_512001 [Xylaria digitata]|nr:hypothetical protein GGR58DRAFT_512001 [Xylaria digitata]
MLLLRLLTRAPKSPNRPPLEVLYPSPNLSASNEIEIDIVAVHGLGSDVDWSWTWQDKKGHRPPVHWLKDPNMLPSVIPHARIIAYNYESRWHADAPKTRLELCGEELVKSLHSFRTDAPERPIIFIAHSLGGLVVLHGLLYASHTEQLRYLPASTVGFAPLGTPFRGTKMQPLAKKVAWLMAPMGSHNGIITELEQDGKHLADKVHAFSELRNKLDIPTTCFFELYHSDFGRKIGLSSWARGRVVEEESAHIPGWGREPLHTDHFALNKFEGPDDRSFRIVSNEVYNMYTNRKSVIERRTTRSCHFMVPFGRNNNFVGRDAILEQLLERIALETIYQVRDKHPDCFIFWVPAKTDIKTLLLVIDNADDTDILFTSPNLVDYLLFSREGSILFTTWNYEITVRLGIPPGNIVAMPKMDDAEATRLLQIGLKESQIENTEVTKRIAYMALNTNVTVSQYLEFCRASNADLIDLLSRQFEDRHQYKGLAKIQNPVATTWLISFEHISQHHPQAANYLKFICLLAKKDIPLSLLPITSKMKMAEAIGSLKAYAFILERETPDSFDIHRLVRIVMRNWLQEKGEWEEWITNAVRRLTREYPFPKRENRRTWTKYLPHGQAVLNIDGAIDTAGDTRLLVNIAETYLVLGKYSEAEKLYRQMLGLIEGALHDKDPDILLCKNNLAVALYHQKKYEEAENIYRQTLMLKEEVLGKRHPGTLTSIDNLALVLGSRRKYKEAEEMQRQALELREEVLGKEHPDTMRGINNLAVTLCSQKKYEEAEQKYRQALELSERVLGKEHPDTITRMANFAVALSKQKRHGEAEQKHRQALELRERILGKMHPDTLSRLQEEVLGKEHVDTVCSFNTVALILGRQGKYKEAEEILGLVEGCPGVITNMEELIKILKCEGKHEGAKSY